MEPKSFEAACQEWQEINESKPINEDMAKHFFTWGVITATEVINESVQRCRRRLFNPGAASGSSSAPDSPGEQSS